MRRPLRVGLLEPYHGGSHAAFVAAMQLHSRHDLRLATLPARKWKWRMRGAAVWFARDDCQWMHDDEGRPVEVILCNDMLSVADLKALLPAGLSEVPIACYFHENQLTYPIPSEQDRDYQYGMTNLTSCLAADAVWFNSRFHMEDFLAAGDRFLRKMPDFVPRACMTEIRSKCQVLAPPVAIDSAEFSPRAMPEVLTILWVHRWEYDKNPEPFFEALLELDKQGCPFKLVLLGERFRTAPPVFESAWQRLANHIVHAGFMPDPAQYHRMLIQSDLVVSTAIQENFGLGVAEAILSGCQPLLPARLVYPEVIPSEYHDVCLFACDSELLSALVEVISGERRLGEVGQRSVHESVVAQCGGENAVRRLDDALESLLKV